MATGREIQLTRQIGEYLVAAELGRRGYLATTFTGNVPHFDILASDIAGRVVVVQVKAVSGKTWQGNGQAFMNINLDVERKRQVVGRPKPEPHLGLICVFVCLGGDGQDQFYVLPWIELRRIARKHYMTYLKKHNGRRPKKFDSYHIALHIKEFCAFKDRWDILAQRK